jgi:hypothetical protein
MTVRADDLHTREKEQSTGRTSDGSACFTDLEWTRPRSTAADAQACTRQPLPRAVVKWVRRTQGEEPTLTPTVRLAGEGYSARRHYQRLPSAASPHRRAPARSARPSPHAKDRIQPCYWTGFLQSPGAPSSTDCGDAPRCIVYTGSLLIGFGLLSSTSTAREVQ